MFFLALMLLTEEFCEGVLGGDLETEFRIEFELIVESNLKWEGEEEGEEVEEAGDEEEEEESSVEETFTWLFREDGDLK